MQYSDTTNKQGIIEDVTFLLGVDSNNYVLADRTRNINERFKMVWQMIFEAYGGWKFMDDNVSDVSTGVPYADQTITSGTALYALPSAALTVNGVEFLRSSGSTLQRLIGISEEEFLQMGGDTAFNSNGTPRYYMLQGDVIRLVPTPNFTLSSALRVFFDQGVSVFTAADTTKVPGFASVFHRMLSIGGSLDYAMARGLTDKATYLQNLWNDYERRLKSFYSKRWKERFPARISSGPDMVEEFK